MGNAAEVFVEYVSPEYSDIPHELQNIVRLYRAIVVRTQLDACGFVNSCKGETARRKAVIDAQRYIFGDRWPRFTELCSLAYRYNHGARDEVLEKILSGKLINTFAVDHYFSRYG